MGWTGIRLPEIPTMRRLEKIIRDDIFGEGRAGLEVVRLEITPATKCISDGLVAYAAVKVRERERDGGEVVMGYVIPLTFEAGEAYDVGIWLYHKAMHESVGPLYFGASASLLAALSPLAEDAGNAAALEWRQNCWRWLKSTTKARVKE